MEDKDIKSWLEDVYGEGAIPVGIEGLVREHRRRLNIIGVTEFTKSDLVADTIAYDMYVKAAKLKQVKGKTNDKV